MSKLDTLLQELCPDGVEYKKLGDVSEIRSGWGFPNSEQGLAYGELPFYKVGDMNHPDNASYMTRAENYISVATCKKLKCNPAPTDTIIFPKIGAAIATNKKRMLSSTAVYDNNVMGIIVDTSLIMPRFMFHFLDGVDLMIFTNGEGAVPSIRKSSVEQYEVPVPPLEVQREIVCILDKFTQLRAELSAELSARRKQYEYYRDELLTFGDDVTRVKFTDVIKGVSSGKNKAKAIEGSFPVYGSTGEIGRTDKAVYSGKRILVARVGANAGFVYVVDGEYDVSDNTLMIEVKDEMNFRYVYQMLVNMNLNKLAKGGGQPLVTAGDLKKLEVYCPAYEIQERVSGILDRFDMLCNDISSGLPAEIEARTKQYEFYRDKLLSFKRKEVS